MLLQPVAKIVKTPWTNSAFTAFIWWPRRNLVQKKHKAALISTISTSCFAGMNSSGRREMISQAGEFGIASIRNPIIDSFLNPHHLCL